MTPIAGPDLLMTVGFLIAGAAPFLGFGGILGAVLSARDGNRGWAITWSAVAVVAIAVTMFVTWLIVSGWTPPAPAGLDLPGHQPAD